MWVFTCVKPTIPWKFPQVSAQHLLPMLSYEAIIRKSMEKRCDQTQHFFKLIIALRIGIPPHFSIVLNGNSKQEKPATWTSLRPRLPTLRRRFTQHISLNQGPKNHTCHRRLHEKRSGLRHALCSSWQVWPPQPLVMEPVGKPMQKWRQWKKNIALVLMRTPKTHVQLW